MSILPICSLSPQFASQIALPATGINVGSVIDRPDSTRGYARTHKLPVRLLLGLPGKVIIGLWL